MDRKLLESFQNLSKALEQLSESLEDSKKSKEPSGSSIEDALKSLNITEQLKSIDDGIKQIQADNKEIIKTQKEVLSAMSKPTASTEGSDLVRQGEQLLNNKKIVDEADKKEKITFIGHLKDLLKKKPPAKEEEKEKIVFIGDPKNKKPITDGVKMILLIAAGVLAIGAAFKLIGKVDFKSVLALSLAMPLLALAFEKISKVKTNLKDLVVANIGLIMMAGTLTLSSQILRFVSPIGAAKMITIVLLSVAFVGISMSISKISDKLKGVDTKSLWKLPVVFLAASVAIALSSHILQFVKPVGFLQLVTVVFIATAFAALGYSIDKMTKNIKNVDPNNIWKLPLVLVAASVAITASSYILQGVKPVGFLQLLTTILISATFVVLSYGLPKLADAVSKVSVGKALLMPVILVELSAAIYGSSLILSKVQTIPFMTLLNIAAQAVVLSVIGVAMGTVIFIFDKMKITFSKAIEGGLSLIAISGSIMASSLLLSMGNYSNAPTLSWTLDAAVSLLVFGVLAFFAGPEGEVILEGSIVLLLIAATVMTSSSILSSGSYTNYPDLSWTLGVGASMLAFGILMSALGLEVMTGIGAVTLAIGAVAILGVAVTIVATAGILNEGTYGNYPKIDWIAGVGLSLLTFGTAMGAIGLISLTGVGALALLAGAASILAIAGTIAGTAAILNQGSFTNYPPLSWAMGVGLSLLEFGTAMAISGPLFPLLWIGSKVIPMIANSIVETAAILSTGNFTGGPSLPWAIGTGIVMTSFGTAMLALGEFIGGTLGVGYLALKAGSSAINLVAQSIVDAAAILATGVYTGGPTESWAKGVGGAISAFAPVYASLSGKGILGIFSGGGPSAEDMANAIRTISQGIVDAALFFSSPDANVSFEGGPTAYWADGVGGAIAAFAPVISNLNKGGIFGLFTGGLSTEDMTNSIVGISLAIVASAQIFAGVNFTGGPTEDWANGVGGAIAAFAPVIKNLNKGGFFSLFTGGLKAEDMTSAIIGISIVIAESSLILAEGNYTPIPMDYINSLSSNVKEVVKLTQYLNGVNLDGGDETFLGIRIGSSQISRMANDYQKLSDSISNLSTAIQSLDVDRLTALKTFTGSIVLMSLMDSEQFEDMMNSLENKAKVFVDVINDLDKGVVGSELSIKTAGAAQQGPSLQDVVVVLNRIDAKLSQISSSSDNISRYVNEIRTPKAQIKKK